MAFCGLPAIQTGQGTLRKNLSEGDISVCIHKCLSPACSSCLERWP